MMQQPGIDLMGGSYLPRTATKYTYCGVRSGFVSCNQQTQGAAQNNYLAATLNCSPYSSILCFPWNVTKYTALAIIVSLLGPNMGGKLPEP